MAHLPVQTVSLTDENDRRTFSLSRHVLGRNDAIHTAGRVYSPQFHTDTRPATLILKRVHLNQYIPKYYKLISKHKNVKLKLTLTLVLTITDTGSTVLT